MARRWEPDLLDMLNFSKFHCSLVRNEPSQWGSGHPEQHIHIASESSHNFCCHTTQLNSDIFQGSTIEWVQCGQQRYGWRRAGGKRIKQGLIPPASFLLNRLRASRKLCLWQQPLSTSYPLLADVIGRSCPSVCPGASLSSSFVHFPKPFSQQYPLPQMIVSSSQY